MIIIQYPIPTPLSSHNPFGLNPSLNIPPLTLYMIIVHFIADFPAELNEESLAIVREFMWIIMAHGTWRVMRILFLFFL